MVNIYIENLKNCINRIIVSLSVSVKVDCVRCTNQRSIISVVFPILDKYDQTQTNFFLKNYSFFILGEVKLSISIKIAPLGKSPMHDAGARNREKNWIWCNFW